MNKIKLILLTLICSLQCYGQSTYNIVDFGASPTQAADSNRIAIQNAINQCNSDGGGLIYIPRGVFKVNKNPAAGTYYLGSLLLTSGKSKITFKGDGIGVSVIKLAPGSYTNDCHVFLLRDNVSKISFSDFTIDGSRGEHTAVQEQMHGIETNGGVNELYINRMEFINTVGDGVRLLGLDNGNDNDKAWVLNSQFKNNGRSGVTVQRGTRNVWIKDNIFESVSDQSIDFEPSGAEEPTEYVISGNIVRHNSTSFYAMTIGGGNSKNIIISGNQFIGGSVFAQNADQIKFVDNIIEGYQNVSAVTILKRATGFSAFNNTIINNGNQPAISINRQSGSSPFDLDFSGNKIQCESTAFSISGAYDVKISNNKIYGGGQVCIAINTTDNMNAELGGFSIENNEVVNFNEFVVFDNYYATNVFKYLKIIGNNHFDYKPTKTISKFVSIKNPLNGSARYIREMLITDNILDGAITSDNQIILGPVFKYFKVRDGRQQEFMCSQSPENLIFAPKGSITTRTDESGIYSRMFKTTSEVSSTGWVNTALSGYIKLIEDSFTGTGQLSAHAPDINLTGNSWTEQNLSWTINAEANVMTTGNGVATIESGTNNCLIKVNVRAVGADGNFSGILFRFQDISNYWFVGISTNADKFRLVERVNGVDITRVEKSMPINAQSYTLDLLLKDSQIKATLDGGNDLNFNSTSLQSNTVHGLVAKVTSRYYFDNFFIYK